MQLSLWHENPIPTEQHPLLAHTRQILLKFVARRIGRLSFAVGEKCISLWLESYRSSESILRPLDNGSMVQEDGNKAPCYPANTVIAPSAHNGTLATHSSFRTHEPNRIPKKGRQSRKRTTSPYLIVSDI